MTVRRLVATAAALAAVVVTPAAAETCGLVTDAENDTVYADRTETSGFVVAEDVDILSADVATDDKMLYAAIRVTSLDHHLSFGGAVYRMTFKSGGRNLFVQAGDGGGFQVTFGSHGYAGGFTAGRVGVRSYRVRGAFDFEGNEIRVQAPLKAFGRGSIEPGSTLSGFAVTARRTMSDFGQVAPGVSTRVSVSDSAGGTGSYVAGEESCVETMADWDVAAHDDDAEQREYERQQREYERQQREYERQQREQEAEYERQQREYERQQREQEAEYERQQREQEREHEG